VEKSTPDSTVRRALSILAASWSMPTNLRPQRDGSLTRS
jgi:hypothetical protein